MTVIAADLLPVQKLVVPAITDAERAASMEALEPVIDRFGSDALRVPRPSFEDISDVLLRAHAHATSPTHAPRWASIPTSELDPTLVGHLRTLGVGCRTVAAAVASSDDAASRAKLPLALVRDAMAHKVKVQRYAEYHLADDPVAARELAGIRDGSGYLDLESDHRRLAVLVAKYTAIVSIDRTYAATDVAECQRYADAIAAELANFPTSPTAWLDSLWAAIRRVYADDVRPTAEWLYRKTPSELAYYPTIFVGFGRPRGSGGGTSEVTDGGAPTEAPTSETGPTPT